MIETLTILEKITAIKNPKIKVIILKTKSVALKQERPWQIKLMGQSMLDWIQNAVKKYNSVAVDYDGQEIVQFVKPLVKDEDFVVVLYSDTPLLRQSTIEQLIEYASVKNAGYVQLPRGYIISNRLIQNGSVEYSSRPQFFEDEDFLIVNNFTNLMQAQKLLKNRINADLIKNGVTILDDNVYIDVTAKIEPGAIIYPNVVIIGDSYIGKESVIYPFVNIIDTKIGKNVKIYANVLFMQNIKDDSIILPYTNKINNI